MHRTVKFPLIICVLVVMCGALAFYFGMTPFTFYFVWNLDELRPDERNSIKSTCLQILEELSSEKGGMVWGKSHLVFKEAITEKQVFELSKATKSMNLRLNNAELITAYLIRFVGNLKMNRAVVCGSADPDNPEHLVVNTVPGNQKVVLAIFSIPSQPLTRTAAIRLAEDKGRFKLTRFDIRASGYNGKDAKHYEKLASRWIAEDKFLPGYLGYSMAWYLSRLSPDIQTSQNNRLTRKLERLQNNSKLLDELSVWKLQHKGYAIFKITLMEVTNEIFPVVLYLSYQNLEPQATESEASHLMDYVKDKYPELEEEFEYILFQAYLENPSDPKKLYQCYRVPLAFNESAEKDN